MREITKEERERWREENRRVVAIGEKPHQVWIRDLVETRDRLLDALEAVEAEKDDLRRQLDEIDALHGRIATLDPNDIGDATEHLYD